MTPHPSTVKAAREILGKYHVPAAAALIEDCCHVSEMAEALANMIPLIKECCPTMSNRLHDKLVRAESLLAKVTK